MAALPDIQRDFAQALLAGGGLDAALFRAGPVAVATAERIYRNNVVAKLLAALGDLYPVVKRLVGDNFFTAAAAQFGRDYPPASPVLAEYGVGFPDFLDSFAPAEDLPWLGDVARLELARHQATNAADREPLAASAFAHVPEERLDDLRLAFHPSVRLVRSRFPVAAIWAAHQGDAELSETVELPDAGTRLLLARPHATVETIELETAAFDFVAALLAGATLADAFAATGGGWDAEPLLADLIGFGVFVSFKLSEEEMP